MTVRFTTDDGSDHALRLTLGAQRRLEKAMGGVPVSTLFSDPAKHLGAELLVQFFAAALRDGQGVPERRAEAVVEILGGLGEPEAITHMFAAVAEAFPEKDEEASGNAEPPAAVPKAAKSAA